MAVNMPEGRPIYPLNVAAQLVGLSPRTIRGYEEAGIIEPARVGGNRQRLYSEQDLKWLRCIRDMIHDEGLTVTAIRRLLDLIPCWQIRHCPADVALFVLRIVAAGALLSGFFGSLSMAVSSITDRKAAASAVSWRPSHCP
mgnify:CR=1 FL=1